MRRIYWTLLLTLPLLTSCAGLTMNLTPDPKNISKQEGSCPDGALKVESPGEKMSPTALQLWQKASAKLPGGKIPREGYLLETLPAGGAIALASDSLGAIRARQSFAQAMQAG